MASKEESASAAGEGTELENLQQKVVKMILEEDDNGIEMTMKSIRIMSRLAELKLRKTDKVLPDKFKCPLSGEIMGDPVVLSSGQTYDRPHIQKWLNEGNLTCPLSKQVLLHTILTPNCLVQQQITQWCKEGGMALPKVYHNIDEDMVTMDRIHLSSLLEKMSSSLSDQKEAAKELRKLTKTSPSCRENFCELTDNAISILLSPLSESESNIELEPDLQEDLITTVLNLSIPENNKKPLAENPVVLPLLVESIKFGTIETRRNAAAALFTLSALDSNKVLIANSDAFSPLLELLNEGHPLAMKDAASAIFSLCFRTAYNKEFNQLGAVNAILEKINDGILVEELLGILALLSADHDAIDEFGDLDTILKLLKIIRHSSLERTREDCVDILYNVCRKDLTLQMVVRAEENKKHTLTALAEAGTTTTRARRKANGILRRINKSFSANSYYLRK